MLASESLLDKDAPIDGRFEPDENGYDRFVFASDERKSIVERWLVSELQTAEDANKDRLARQAENRDTYSAVPMVIPGDESGKAVLPSPIARIPADQIIASTHNVIMRPRKIFSCDPYYDEEYDVLVEAHGPQDAYPDPTIAPGTPIVIKVRSEEIARHLEQGVNYLLRERIDFEDKNQRVVHSDVIEGYAWIKTCRRKKRRNVIRPKITAGLRTVDLDKVEEYGYDSGDDVYFEFVHDSNMLRPNLYQPVDDLPWLAEYDPESSDEFLARYSGGDYYLVATDEEAERLSKAVSIALDDSRDRNKRPDGSAKNTAAADGDCDMYDVWAKRTLRVKDEETGKTVFKRYKMLFRFHRGAGKLVSAHKHPYRHQRSIHTVFKQFLDGSCTVGIVKYNQQIGTLAAQAELKGAVLANVKRYWYDTSSPAASNALAGGAPMEQGTAIPAIFGKEWGMERGSSEHFSLLPFMQWNDNKGQQTSKVSDYEAGTAAPSHTSPNTVSMLLDKSGQTNVLFLRSLNRGWVNCVKLLLETMQQFKPLGMMIPVRDPLTKAITMAPFMLPVGEAIYNFRWTLTAADEEAASERNPEQIAQLLSTQQAHVASVMQSFTAIVDPNTTEAQTDFHRKAIAAEQSIMERLLSLTRSDLDTFDVMPEVDAVIAEKREMIAQAKLAQEQAAANAADQNAQGGGLVPPAEAASDGGAPTGLGEQPGVAGGAPDITGGGVPSTDALGPVQA